MGGRLTQQTQQDINRECGENPSFIDSDILWNLYKQHQPHDIDANAQRCVVNPLYKNDIIGENGAIDQNYIQTFNDRLLIEGQYVPVDTANREWEQINYAYNAKCIQPGYLRHEGQCFNKGDGVPGEMTLKRYLSMFKVGDAWPETWPTRTQIDAKIEELGTYGDGAPLTDLNMPVYEGAIPAAVRVFVSCDALTNDMRIWPDAADVYQNLRGQPVTDEHMRICGIVQAVVQNQMSLMDFSHMNIMFAFSVCLNVVMGAYIVSPKKLITAFCIFIPLLCAYAQREAIANGARIVQNAYIIAVPRVIAGASARIQYMRNGIIIVRQRHQNALVVLRNAQRPRTIRQGLRIVNHVPELNLYERLRLYISGLQQSDQPDDNIERINEQIAALQAHPVQQWHDIQHFINDYRDFVMASVAATNNQVRVFACPVCGTMNSNAHCTNRLTHHFPRDHTRAGTIVNQLVDIYGDAHLRREGEITDNRCLVCNYFCPSDVGYIPLNRNAYDTLWNNQDWSLVYTWSHGQGSQGYYVLGYPGHIVMDPNDQRSNRSDTGGPMYNNISLTPEYKQRIDNSLRQYGIQGANENQRITNAMIYGPLCGIPISAEYNGVRQALQPQLFGWANDLSRRISNPNWDNINRTIYEQVMEIRRIYIRGLDRQIEPRIAELRQLQQQNQQQVEVNNDEFADLTPEEIAFQIAALEAFNDNRIPQAQIEERIDNLQREFNRLPDLDPMNEEELAQLNAMLEAEAPAPAPRNNNTYRFIIPRQDELPRPPPRNRNNADFRF
jgi:hypothetical protein